MHVWKDRRRSCFTKNTKTVFSVALLSALFADAIPSQFWVDRNPAAGPDARAWHGMAFDDKRGVTVLFGGHSGSRYYSDTWEWDGKTWTKRTPKTTPGNRSHVDVAFDSARGRLVLFGGFDSTKRLADTWEWDGTNWHEMKPTTSPPARGAHAMAYDPTRKRVVVFGGQNAKTELSDTWEWDGVTWKQVKPKTSPPARYDHSLSYDHSSRRVILFGGADRTGAKFGNTWLWDGSDWTRQNPKVSPPRTQIRSIGSDPFTKACFIFGGMRSGQVMTDETWGWNGSTWYVVLSNTRPARRRGAAIAFDSRRARVVLFGGANSSGARFDTWEFRAPPPASYTTFGSGCAGVAKPPSIRAPAPPRIGKLFTLEIGNLKPRTGGLIIFGDSNSSPFPLSLSFLDMPGCHLLVNWLLEVGFFTNSGGVVPWTVTIPQVPALIGGQFYNQVWVLDSAANRRGIATSNGGKGVFGF